MLMPGLSMSQIPMRVRLYFAIALSFAVYVIVPAAWQPPKDPEPIVLLGLISYEILIGVLLVLPIRFLFLAVTFLGEITMQYIGLNPIPGTPIGDDQASTSLSALFSITAVVLLFSTGFVEQFILGLAGSYQVFSGVDSLPMSEVLPYLSGYLDDFFNIVLRLGAPIIIYAVLVNMLAGLVNKLTPQLPIYFVSTPFLICGGIVLLMMSADDMMRLLSVEFEQVFASM